jgi:aminoglycoside phosphotransferase (APT) family kinase protein
VVTGPGPLIASGRDADIYGYGDGLVLRRARGGRSLEAEARVMEYARSHGYPVPAVDHLSDDGTDLVMERVDGPQMVQVLERRPWTIRANGALLGDLHRRLHQIPGPDWLRPSPLSEGDRLIHLDLHPLNILLGPSGPVVIDWSNARRGAPVSDVALTWVLMLAGEVPAGRLRTVLLSRFRRTLLGGFLGGFDLDPVRSELRAVVAWKVTDPHMSASEQTRMWAVVEEEETPA